MGLIVYLFGWIIFVSICDTVNDSARGPRRMRSLAIGGAWLLIIKALSSLKQGAVAHLMGSSDSLQAIAKMGKSF
jgi:hypothetical protein